MSEYQFVEPVEIETIVEARLTYLQARGIAQTRRIIVPEASMEAGQAAIQPPSEYDELVFMDFGHYGQVAISDGKNAVQMLRSKDQPTGPTFMATDWRRGDYELTDAAELTELPLYSAEWLGRYVLNHTVPQPLSRFMKTKLLLPRQFYKADRPLMANADANDPASPHQPLESPIHRAERLTHLLAQLRTDMAERFVERGMSVKAPERRTKTC